MNQQQLNDWNAQHPVGTAVLAWPGHQAEYPMRTFTRSEAWALSSGHAVVQVEGHAGGIVLTHIDKFDGDLVEHRQIMYMQQAEEALVTIAHEAKRLFSDGIDEWRRAQALSLKSWAAPLATGTPMLQLQYTAKLQLLQWLQGTVDQVVEEMRSGAMTGQHREGVEL